MSKCNCKSNCKSKCNCKKISNTTNCQNNTKNICNSNNTDYPYSDFKIYYCKSCNKYKIRNIKFI